MPSSPKAPATPLWLICGDDEFAVKERSSGVFREWTESAGGMDHEIIDAQCGNASEAVKAVARVQEALQTLPFFGGSKIVWFKNCNFVGEEARLSTAASVNEAVTGLAQTIKTFAWEGVRLLISAGKVDKRKGFYKTVNSVGKVEICAGISGDDRDWAEQAEVLAARQLKERGKRATDEALARIVACVGPNARQLDSEIEKLCLYAGDRGAIEPADVDSIVTRNKQARAFALGDALGDRDMVRLLRVLDEELWSMKFDSKKSEIGLLYGLIGKVRTMLFAREMQRAGMLEPTRNFSSFKAQLSRIPKDSFPEDRRINPLAVNPYVLFRAAGQSANYSSAELVRAMGLLLECNRQLVSSGADNTMILQQALTQIVKRTNLRGSGRGAKTPRAA